MFAKSNPHHRLLKSIQPMGRFLAITGFALLPLVVLTARAEDSVAPDKRLTVALLSFADKTGDPQSTHWRYSLPRMVGAPLKEAKSIRIYPADACDYGLRKLKLKAGDPVDAAKAKQIGEIVELTYDLHTTSPFGILATPENKRFEARLFGTREDYRKAGGPDILKQGGLAMLLAGESPAEVGRRIESALIKDLEMNLKFVENPKSNVLFQGFKH